MQPEPNQGLATGIPRSPKKAKAAGLPTLRLSVCAVASNRKIARLDEPCKTENTDRTAPPTPPERWRGRGPLRLWQGGGEGREGREARPSPECPDGGVGAGPHAGPGGGRYLDTSETSGSPARDKGLRLRRNPFAAQEWDRLQRLRRRIVARFWDAVRLPGLTEVQRASFRKRARKIAECGVQGVVVGRDLSQMVAVRGREGDRVAAVSWACHDRFCPLCSARDAAARARRLAEHIGGMEDAEGLLMLTPTQRGVEGESYAVTRRRFRAVCARFQRTPEFRSCWTGYMGREEATPPTADRPWWHVHAHMVVQMRPEVREATRRRGSGVEYRLPRAMLDALKAAWKRCGEREGAVCDVLHVMPFSPEAVAEVTKYAVKPADIAGSGALVAEAAAALHAARTLWSDKDGAFHGWNDEERVAGGEHQRVEDDSDRDVVGRGLHDGASLSRSQVRTLQVRHWPGLMERFRAVSAVLYERNRLPPDDWPALPDVLVPDEPAHGQVREVPEDCQVRDLD